MDPDGPHHFPFIGFHHNTFISPLPQLLSSIAALCPPTINLVYCTTMCCYSCPRMSQGCMIAHACWIGMISSCYCSQLDTQKMIQNAMSLQTLLGINLRTLRSPPLGCSFPIERTNCFVHTHWVVSLWLGHALLSISLHLTIVGIKPGGITWLHGATLT